MIIGVHSLIHTHNYVKNIHTYKHRDINIQHTYLEKEKNNKNKCREKIIVPNSASGKNYIDSFNNNKIYAVCLSTWYA